ncbi:hypothetical protein HF086_010284 [Spodoptera exigua]|uniref:Uncharacterized protein n=1 Tax=Spodoptera exigua TaxID=7107 RepID=A0A922SCK2_SPOEX|nr:hypothetical protein HF086_010284 [Spodoptera exigua]
MADSGKKKRGKHGKKGKSSGPPPLQMPTQEPGPSGSSLKSPTSAGPSPISPPAAGPGPKSPPVTRPDPKSPSAAGPGPKSPPAWASPTQGKGPSPPQASTAAQRSARGQHSGDADIQQRLQSTHISEKSKPTPSSKAGGSHQGDKPQSEQASVLRTKPLTLESKKGHSGTAIDVKANYFAVKTTPQWRLYQYHVDFSPDEDNTGVRKGLLRDHAKRLGGYLFDGTVLYTVKRLHPDPLELFSIRKNDEQRMRIMVKLTCDVAPGDYHYIQIFNIIIRKCFQILDLQLMGRDYFDPLAKVDIPEYRLQIWPGYKTTINQYEDRLLMITEITHKVSKIVMTIYNKKTYKVDDIAWQDTPKSTFKMRDEKITYLEYYKKKYNLTIRDLQQPLLISRSKPRDIRAGMPELVYLVPELCRQTGLTDEMRNNFRLMKALDSHTKVGPDVRIQKLLHFNRRLTQSREVVKLGAAPWRVQIPLNSILVIGYDVCHDTRSKEKSFGGFVASLDQNLTRFYSAVNSHTSGEELSNHMGFNIASALTKFKNKNGSLPNRIFIYRDGVGQIKKKLAEVYGGPSYKMAFIVVSKRINTRIFLDRGRNGENPRPGTVIDDVVTLPERYDFYLVSQNVRDGTISPTSYNVIEDTTGLHPDRMQWLTYKMTHLYFNCSAQVRVPAVCQYAHKLAFLAANSLHSQPHYALTDTLYFL